MGNCQATLVLSFDLLAMAGSMGIMRSERAMLAFFVTAGYQ